MKQNDPKPLGEDGRPKSEAVTENKNKKEEIKYEAKKTSSFVPSKDSAIAMSLEGSKKGSLPAQSMNPKYI